MTTALYNGSTITHQAEGGAANFLYLPEGRGKGSSSPKMLRSNES